MNTATLTAGGTRSNGSSPSRATGKAYTVARIGLDRPTKSTPIGVKKATTFAPVQLMTYNDAIEAIKKYYHSKHKT
jgi:hypothetical protein